MMLVWEGIRIIVPIGHIISVKIGRLMVVIPIINRMPTNKQCSLCEKITLRIRLKHLR